MRDSVPKGMPHTAAGHRGQHRPSPIYREYFMDLLPFEGHAARADTPPLPLTAATPTSPRDGEA
ncbi:MAG TPA: hypothetical protein VD995_12350 [Azospirillum sp.]|nr:hypothetical protein [Azospirillum sp.]